jgi:hypothetical protein
MDTRFTLCAALVACVIACGSKGSSKADNDDSPNGGATDVSGEGSSTGGGASGGGGGGGGGGTAAGNGAAIVFNEVLAVGATEWIEIVNPGTEAIDVSDYMIAGSDKDTNEPKMGSAMKFPAGTKIAPGAHVVILTSRAKEEPVGPYTRESCLPDGPDSCFYASFGVSATKGESLHFLAPDGSVINSTPIPMSLSADAGGSTSSSHCRLPDVTGEFASCALTPGQPNRAP